MASPHHFDDHRRGGTRIVHERWIDPGQGPQQSIQELPVLSSQDDPVTGAGPSDVQDPQCFTVSLA